MVAVVVVAAGCGGTDEQAGPAAAEGEAADGVVELASLDLITKRFEADRGKPRLLLIFSPT
jgi:hypothetical protein